MVSIGSGKVEKQQADLKEEPGLKDQYYSTNESFRMQSSDGLQRTGMAAMRETDASRNTEIV